MSRPIVTAFAAEMTHATFMGASGAMFGVERSCAWQTIKPDWDKVYCAGEPTVFQSTRWLTGWYESLAGQTDIEPLLLTVRNLRTGLVALYLPLLKHTVNGVRIVEFADLDLTGYNAPLLGPAAPREPETVAAMWRDLRWALRRLPGGIDLVRLRKMPVDLNGTPNPFAAIKSARASSLKGNIITTGDNLDAYRFSIRQMQLARSWRVFTRNANAAFRIITDKEEALSMLDIMEAQQAKRNRCLGLKSVLDDKVRAAFYRNLIASGVDDGYVVMSALTSGEEVVATAFGIRQGEYYAVLRISNAGERWSNCSPGRLVLDRTIAALHKEGVRQFDLSVGNDELKRRFGAVKVQLAEVTAAISLRGLPLVMREQAARWLHSHPRLERSLRRLWHQASHIS
jgi:CelD/BcsL family acetyltransferase involved in cellulose biosynthesis